MAADCNSSMSSCAPRSRRSMTQCRTQRRISAPDKSYPWRGGRHRDRRLRQLHAFQQFRPHCLPRSFVRPWEFDHHVDAAEHILVDPGGRIGGDDRQAFEGLDPPQQIADLDIGVAVVASLTSLRFPNRASASSNSRIAPASFAASNSRRSFFSVSPTCLDTTAPRSMRNRRRPVDLARAMAAIVLPVPFGPRNSARRPPST